MDVRSPVGSNEVMEGVKSHRLGLAGSGHRGRQAGWACILDLEKACL